MRQIASRISHFLTDRSPSRLINRGLPAHAHIQTRVRWPLAVLLIAVVNQLLAPHLIWITLIIVLSGVYLTGWLWLRSLAPNVSLIRQRAGAILVAGDVLHEEFTLVNQSRAPLLWAEFIDASTVPDYQPGRVASCGALSQNRWRSTAACKRRGVHRLGPHRLEAGDPLNLFTLTLHFSQSETVLIYPRVVQLSRLAMPRGAASGDERQRRPLFGSLPAASVRPHQHWDSLRSIHWPTTAHRGQLMVRELELEPVGDVWIALDAHADGHRRMGERSTFETAITVAASLAASLVDGSERRAVGLLTTTARQEMEAQPDTSPTLVTVPPALGRAHLWRIMAALAPLEMSDAPLHELLRSVHGSLGRRRSLFVITAQVRNPEQVQRWLAELIHFQAGGVASSVLLVSTDDDEAAIAEVRRLLVEHGIGVDELPVGAALRPMLTYRRRRVELRSTPTGGVVAVEVEEEVG
jgi:uncharacterized protein (DUF58 family)